MDSSARSERELASAPACAHVRLGCLRLGATEGFEEPRGHPPPPQQLEARQEDIRCEEGEVCADRVHGARAQGMQAVEPEARGDARPDRHA